MTSLASAQGQFLAHHEALNHSAKQISHYQTTFRDFDRFLTATRRKKTLEHLKTETFEGFVVWLKDQPRQNWRGSTERSMVGVAGHMKDLRAFVRWLREEAELITWRVNVPKPRVPKRLFPILSDSDLALLWRAPMLAGTSEACVRNRAIFGLLLDTGIRLGECAGLTPANVRGSFVQVIGKGDKERLVPITAEVGKLLADWAVIRNRVAEQTGDTNAPTLFQLTGHGIQQVVERLADKTGIAIFPHKVRHTAATLMLRRGIDIYTVKTILGHQSIATTEAYLSLCPEDIRAKHQAGSPFLALQGMVAQESAPVRMKKRRFRDAS